MPISKDLLPVVLEFVPIATLFAARLTCKYVLMYTRQSYAKFIADEIAEGSGKTVFEFLAAKNNWFPKSVGVTFHTCAITDINACWRSIKDHSYLVTIKTDIPCELTDTWNRSVIETVTGTSCLYLKVSQEERYVSMRTRVEDWDDPNREIELEPLMDIRVNNIYEPKLVFGHMVYDTEHHWDFLSIKLLNVIEITGNAVEEKSILKHYRKMCGKK